MPNKQIIPRIEHHVYVETDACSRWKRFPCLIWTGHLSKIGYASTRFRGIQCLAHRAAYVKAKGEIPDGLELDHLCGNRACIQPEHLDPVTHAVNVRRGKAAELKRAITSCPHGHKYIAANTVIDKKGKRGCKTCNVIHARAYRKRKKEKSVAA